MNEYYYAPTDMEEELILSEIPIEVLEDSIKDQFADPSEYRKNDYVQTFITKYNILKNNLLEDDLIQLDSDRTNFLVFIEKIFEEKLGVGFVNLDSLAEDDQDELIHLTYRYFIKNIKKNFVHVVTNYIEKNKSEIASNYEKKKDVTTLAFKSEIDDEEEVTILANLTSVIEDIFDELKNQGTIDEFMDLCEGDEPSLELSFVRHAYDDLELSGNFVEKYIELIEDSYFTVEIQSKVRNKILKKYPKRTKKDNSDQAEVEEIDNETDATDESVNPVI